MSDQGIQNHMALIILGTIISSNHHNYLIFIFIQLTLEFSDQQRTQLYVIDVEQRFKDTLQKRNCNLQEMMQRRKISNKDTKKHLNTIKWQRCKVLSIIIASWQLAIFVLYYVMIL